MPKGKGADAVTLRPFWRLVIAGNDDDAGLQVCPALSPMRLLELIDSLALLNGTDKWEGSASDFERALRSKDSSGMLDRIFVTGQAAGRMLTELARVSPSRVERTNWGGTSHYRVFAATRR
ncbi:MAG: hypothetical protein MUE94_12695 [Verrucomicrobia bacterium]|jgi:hypothetical protein|nr:hypothetical protein [Verrucomicrobiota bacterium]